ncbi:hypothetical protein INR49_013593, partial [Caranx melampygus]
MELEAASRRIQLVRLVFTLSQAPPCYHGDAAVTCQFHGGDAHRPVMAQNRPENDGKVQNFGKRCQAAKRDPNCAVDSSGLKLWKRRWFVLSNYCLFYYKGKKQSGMNSFICALDEQQGISSFVHLSPAPPSDSREESVLGSIPLPSYKILFCTPRECKNRKFTFKGMRSYFFSADTQEDMLGWVRALSQSAAMEPDSSMNRRCSSYQDFTQIGGSTESVDFPKSPSDGEGPSQKHRHVSRTLSEPSHLTGGRMGTSHSEQRGRRRVRQRNSRFPSHSAPSPPEFSRRRACGPNQEEDSFPGQHTPPTQAETLGTGSLTSRGQLGSRPHTPVGRVDIRPQDDPIMIPQTLYYAPASPSLEFKSPPNTPVSERWQNLSKSYSTGAQADLLPPLPPHRELHMLPTHHTTTTTITTITAAIYLFVCYRQLWYSPLYCAACSYVCIGGVQTAAGGVAEPGPRAQEEALTQKALLQEDLVTIRARMCDVSLEQSQAQRELWMMEDILAGLKVNRDHFRFLLGLQRHHMFQPPAPHPGSPGSPTERLQSGLPMDVEQEPPARPALPQELLESQQSRYQGHGYTESPYEGIYSHAVDPAHRRGNSQPDLLNTKMSEEEQVERMKRNQERLSNRKKPPMPTPGTQTSETREEAPFPLRVTRVVTAVLPSSLVARRVSVEDPPAELDTPLPEQIPPEMQQRLTEQSKKMLNKPPRHLLLESPDQNRSLGEMQQDQPVKRTSRQQHLGALRASKKEPRQDAEEQPTALLTPDMDPDPCLTPEQREAKLRRVERIRERVMRSISDTEITKNDGNNAQPSCRPEEEEGPLMAESVPVDITSSVGGSPNEDSKDSDVDEKRLSTDDKLQNSTVETEKQAALNTSVNPAKETHVYEEIQKKECEDTSMQESQLKVQEADNQASVEDVGSDQGLGECAKTSEEQSWAKESQDTKVGQERSEELRKSRSYSEENKETVKERGDNIAPSSSVYEGGRMVRSASFGKAR